MQTLIQVRLQRLSLPTRDRLLVVTVLLLSVHACFNHLDIAGSSSSTARFRKALRSIPASDANNPNEQSHPPYAVRGLTSVKGLCITEGFRALILSTDPALIYCRAFNSQLSIRKFYGRHYH
jgi:hypothetical protein